ncbi:Multiple RNA-binding domain-containing protein 1 [Bienertia sinuspersici]
MGSRICVKNLPKYVNEDRLKEFFSEKGEITDAKLMRTREGKNRQFAFIGYRTEKEAEEAIKYFNKSYLDTSRILCEVAWRVGATNVPRPWSQHSKKQEKMDAKSNKICSNTVKLDKKIANKCNENDDPKFQEFLEVMQPRSKSKLWANDLVAPTSDQISQGRAQHDKSKQVANNINGGESSQREVELHHGNQVNLKDVVHDDVLSDMDYFKSRVKKDWSDSESDTDGENAIDLDHDDKHGDGASQGNKDEEDGGQQMSPMEKVGCEFMNAGNLPPNSEVANEVLKSARLYVRNLPYAATEDELAELFSEYGNVSEVHVVIDKETKRSKGFAFVLYEAPEGAIRALEELDHSIFQGRLLHVMPAKTKDLSNSQENFGNEGKSKTFKERRMEDKKASEAAGNTQAWNSLFMRSDTVVENIARKYGISKSDFLDREADDLAVRIALGETQIIAETKKALENAGVNVESLEKLGSGKTKGVKRSNHVLLVKNLPYSSTESELSKLFGKFGSIDKIILPPTRTLALRGSFGALSMRMVDLAASNHRDGGIQGKVSNYNEFTTLGNFQGKKKENKRQVKEERERLGSSGGLETRRGEDEGTSKIGFSSQVIFIEPAEARAACRGLAYKRYKDAPLYLEWAPSNILSQDLQTNDKSIVREQEARKILLEQQLEGISEAEMDPDRVESRSLYVKNLSFKTADESLREHISENMKEGRISSVKIVKHLKHGKNVSTGFGFIEFDSIGTATNVCRDLQGTVLDGHALTLQLCHAKKDEKVLKKAGNDQSSTKLIVRNVAFEATEKDLRQLFSPFGQLKSLRLPMKLGKHRGFAFIEFVTKQEAQNALNALSNTHLYGRHLVLERAKEGETLEELRARTAAQFSNDEGFQNATKISRKRKITALSDQQG